jgi:hypothetical protein
MGQLVQPLLEADGAPAGAARLGHLIVKVERYRWTLKANFETRCSLHRVGRLKGC